VRASKQRNEHVATETSADAAQAIDAAAAATGRPAPVHAQLAAERGHVGLLLRQREGADGAPEPARSKERCRQK
jgi:hypothetical protein